MKRDRNHVLEDLSVTALRTALPELWIVHEYRRDYGIDLQIEIFGQDGNTTGLRVYGQLKATDKSETDDVLCLDRDHFEYWSSHTDSVLLLRFFAATNTLKWCWMHDLEWRLKPSAVSVNVAPYLELWQKEISSASIEELARLRRQVLGRPLSFPATISVRNASGGMDGSLELAGSIAERLPRSSFEVFGATESLCHFDVLLENRKLRIGHAGLAGFVVTCEHDDSAEHIADVAVLLIFLISCRYDRNAVARTIATHSSAILLRVASSEILPSFIDGLVYSLGIDQAIPMVFSKLEFQEDPVVWLIVHAAGLRASKRYGQLDLWIKQLQDWAERPPNLGMAASAAYNAANCLANAMRFQEALPYYRLAGERDSTYLDRDYYWAEVGAAEFETDHAIAAVAAYRKAYEISHSPAEQWRLGDALFHCGFYESAYQAIASAIAGDESLGSYPRLVMLVCEELLGKWGIKEQNVKPVGDETQRALMAERKVSTEQQVVKTLRPYLEICAIDPLLSFNAGHLANLSNQQQIASYRYLTCALRNRGDTEAWSRAIASAVRAKQPDILALTIDTAYFYRGEELINSVLKSFVPPEGVSKEAADQFQRELIAMIRSTKKEGEESAVIRVHGPSQTRQFVVGT